MARTTFSGPVASQNGFITIASTSNKLLTIQAPAGLSADTVLTFPNGAGSNGQQLTTDGTGVLTWAASGGIDLASPPAIGNTAPNTGGFTTLTATSVGVTNTSASTSLFEPVVVSSTLTGAGVTGGRAKFATTINAAAGGFSNALKADVTYGASGSTTGLGSAFVAEMTLSAGTSAGTYAPVEIELNAATGDSTGTLTSLIHASVNGTGADSVVNANAVLVNLVGMTAGSAGDTDMVTAPGGNFAATDLTSGIGIKVKVGASFFYIPLVAAADYQDN
jgi:hypothetical protein